MKTPDRIAIALAVLTLSVLTVPLAWDFYWWNFRMLQKIVILIEL